MKGFGKKVSVAFLSIVSLLAVSGVISLSELSNLSYDTDEILVASSRDMELTKELLRAAHDHSRAMIDVALFDDESRREGCHNALKTMNQQISNAHSKVPTAVYSGLDTLAFYANELQRVADSYHETQEVVSVDSLGVKTVVVKTMDGRKWYSENYEPAYNRFIDQVNRYISLSHGELEPRAEQLSKNAYRSVMPVLISLAVMIAIVLMLYYFVYIYVVKPLLVMSRSLSDYLMYKMSYKPNATMVDEVKSLNDGIEHLINSSVSEIKQRKDAI